MPEQKELCDFCNSEHPTWDFPAKDFMSVILAFGDEGQRMASEWGSEGGWLACDTCHRIILLNDPGALARHAAEEHIRQGKLQGETQETLVEALTGLYGAFMQYRTGPPVPWRGESG